MQKIPEFPMPIITDRLIIRPTQITDAKIPNETILESLMIFFSSRRCI